MHGIEGNGKSVRRSYAFPYDTRMADELAAVDVRKLLDLEPNATCGFVRITYVSSQSIAAGGLPSPFSDGRPVGSALYFMVTPTAPVRLHRIRNDQLFTTTSAIRSKYSCCATTAPANGSLSARICAVGSASNSSSPATPSIRRG